jgi:hypothetical protein
MKTHLISQTHPAVDHSKNSVSAGAYTLVIIDAGVHDYQSLAAGLLPGIDLLILAGDRDGIQQITEHLRTNQTASPQSTHPTQIQIFAHGSPGTVYLGNSELSLSTLSRYAEDLRAWFTGDMGDGGDGGDEGEHRCSAIHLTQTSNLKPHLPHPPPHSLTLYACNLAAGDAGAEFLAKLHTLTQASIAASTKKVGNAQLGGHWRLDATIGGGSPAPAIAATTLQTYPGLLNEYSVTNTADNGAGSLRQAILDANANPGLDTIRFDIPGSDIHTITLASALPNITGTVIIDGYTQTGATENTLAEGNDAALKIVLDGNNLASGNGLRLADGSDGSTIQGLVIQNFAGSGIRILSGSDGNTIRGNFIGTDVTGSADFGNGSDGVTVNSANNQIGGSELSDRNVISGNDGSGVLISGTNATGNQVQGNYIGTDATGTAALGNIDFGVGITNEASNNRVGTNADGSNDLNERNIIAANGRTKGFDGVGIDAAANNNTVAGNYLGTDVTGSLDLGNGWAGVYLGTGATDNTIGGTLPVASNLIVGNETMGVQIDGDGTSGNEIIGNTIGKEGIPNAVGVDIGSIFGGQSPVNSLVQGNTISFNTNQGVRVSNRGSGTTGHTITANSIFSNGGLGIDLVPEGITGNDAGDADTGANNLQNFPVLSNVAGDTISGFLNSTADTMFQIEFFASSAYDDSGAGEGATYLGSVETTTDDSGDATFSFTSPEAVGDRVITATATDADGNTSEFSLRNQAPVNTAPASASTSEDTAILFSGNAISVSDGDAADTVIQVTLTASNGTLSVTNGSGVSFTGNGSATVVFTDTIANINPALNGLEFIPALNYNGTEAAIEIVTNDQSPDALGGALSDTDTISITVSAVPDAPSFTGDATLTAIAEDTTDPGGATISSMFASLFSDPDQGASFTGIAVVGNPANATTEGTWDYSADDGTTWSAIGTVGDDSTTLALVLAPSTGVRFVPVADYNGTPPALTVRALDNTYGGSFSDNATRTTLDTSTNGGETAISGSTASLGTEVTAVNDAPSFTAGENQAILEDAGAQTVSGWATAISPGAPNEASQELTFNVSNDNNALFSQQPAIDPATGDLTYTPAADMSGSATVTVQLQDNGGGPDISGPETFTITVADNDIFYTVSEVTANVTEGDSGSVATDLFTIARSGVIDQASTVNVALGGDATSGSDYENLTVIGTGVSLSGNTLTFAAGATTATLRADIVGDLLDEDDGETLNITLSNATALAPGYAATVTTDNASLTVGDDSDDSPRVTSVNRADTDPTNAETVGFTVTFDRAVTGVDATDFSLTAVGLTGASVTGVAGSDDTYTVTVATGSGDGTLRLDLLDDDSIQDTATNPLGSPGTNNGDFTTGETYTIDKTPPSQPTISGDPQTTTTTPTLSGTAEPGSAVEVFDGNTALGTTTTNGDGNWSFTPDPLSEGSYTLTAQVMDEVGNRSVSEPLTIVVDTTPPEAPVVSGDPPAGNDDTPTLSGSSEPGATIEILDGDAVLGTAIADESGNWSFTPDTPLSPGDYSLTFRAIDGAGNVGSLSAPLTFTIAASSPSTPPGPGSTPTAPGSVTPAGPIIGTPQKDVLVGTDGDDTIIGLASNDRLFGNAGNDIMFGDEGNDRLFGGAGDDILIGGTGNNRLKGDDGADVFVIERGAGLVRILDFDPAVDKVGLPQGKVSLGAVEVSRFRDNNTLFTDGREIFGGLVGITPNQLSRRNAAVVDLDTLI